MSEISVTMDVNAIFPVTSRCGCNTKITHVRITLVQTHPPSDETTYNSDVSERLFLHAGPVLNPPPSIVTVRKPNTVGDVERLYCLVMTAALAK